MQHLHVLRLIAPPSEVELRRKMSLHSRTLRAVRCVVSAYEILAVEVVVTDMAARLFPKCVAPVSAGPCG